MPADLLACPELPAPLLLLPLLQEAERVRAANARLQREREAELAAVGYRTPVANDARAQVI